MEARNAGGIPIRPALLTELRRLAAGLSIAPLAQ
jgi:hypothetical protein